MGYDVHISRKDEWFSDEGNEISLDEWKQYVESDPDMRLDNFAEAKTPEGVLRVESEGLSVWVGYSGHEADGNIKVKNPDEEILKKMFSIAQSLDAKVQGDECEIYDENGQSNWEELRKQEGHWRRIFKKMVAVLEIAANE